MAFRGELNLGYVLVIFIVVVSGFYLYQNFVNNSPIGTNPYENDGENPSIKANKAGEITVMEMPIGLEVEMKNYRFSKEGSVEFSVTKTVIDGKNSQIVKIKSAVDKALKIFVAIPKDIAQSSAGIAVSEEYTVVSDDPVIMIPISLKGTETKSIRIDYPVERQLAFLYIMVEKESLDGEEESLHEIGEVLNEYVGRKAIVASETEARAIEQQISIVLNGQDTMANKIAKLKEILEKANKEKVSFVLQASETKPWASKYIWLLTPPNKETRPLYKVEGNLADLTTTTFSDMEVVVDDAGNKQRALAIDFILKPQAYNKFSSEVPYDVYSGNITIEMIGAEQKFVIPTELGIVHDSAVRIYPTTLQLHSGNSGFPAKPLIIINSAPFPIKVQPILSAAPIEIAPFSTLGEDTSQLLGQILYQFPTSEQIISAPVGGFSTEVIKVGPTASPEYDNLSNFDLWAPSVQKNAVFSPYMCGDGYCGCADADLAAMSAKNKFDSEQPFKPEDLAIYLRAAYGNSIPENPKYSFGVPIFLYDEHISEDGCEIAALDGAKLENGHVFIILFNVDLQTGLKTVEAVDLGLDWAIFKRGDRTAIISNEAEFRKIMGFLNGIGAKNG
jgi:hypothetical protein